MWCATSYCLNGIAPLAESFDPLVIASFQQRQQLLRHFQRHGSAERHLHAAGFQRCDHRGDLVDRAGLGGRGVLSEKDIDEALREVRVALLEADVALPVVKDFISKAKELAAK